MQITIQLPETLTKEKVSQVIKDIENLLVSQGINSQVAQDLTKNIDPWDEINFSDIAVDTGISDFAENHDHYLYNTPKND
jgi:hypothetical protein